MVKDLIWTEMTSGIELISSYTAFGTFEVGLDPSSYNFDGSISENPFYFWEFEGLYFQTNYKSLDDAKIAAQNWWELQIKKYINL